MTTRHELFHASTAKALLDLSNPKKSVCRPLVKGKAAGKLELIHQLYPPRGMHRNSFPATYLFTLEDWVTHDLALMVSMVDTCDGGEGLIFGFIGHDHWQEISEKTGMQAEPQHHFAAVKYNPIVRTGFVYLYTEAYAIIEKLHEHRLQSAREMRGERQQAATASSQRQTQRTSVQSQKKHPALVLLADDNANFRETMKAVLEHRGCYVESVENGHQLIGKLRLAAVAGRQYDFVVTDNDMPRVTGLQALRLIRGDDQLHHIPVVVLTASPSIKGAVEKAGGIYCDKGGNMDDFNAVVAGLITQAAKKSS